MTAAPGCFTQLFQDRSWILFTIRGCAVDVESQLAQGELTWSVSTNVAQTP
jgi:hypothetical protein